MIVLETDPLLEIYDQDANGNFMYSYNGIPFTGKIQWYNDNNILLAEQSFQDGCWWGLQRFWHENGQLESEYTIGEGLYDGLSRTWSEQGILKSSRMWVKGIMQPL